MPIAALPTSTVRAIGSAQTLTDSASLVKELIDNAIDGRASTVSIEISENALDDIRVKDNGHGIAPEDRAMVCQRYCTSKIRDLDDLRDIGGRSLGFRGEALASAAEISGCLTIATKIEGEATAIEVKFDRQGHIASEKRLSLPVGTTVRVERFLDTLPVRRQTAEKTSLKMLVKVKRLLLAYALSRPHLRLSLKILKAKNDKGNWRYAGVGHSKTGAPAFDAATETIGKKVTDQCQWICSSWSSAGQQADGNLNISRVDAPQDEVYTFEAVLVKPECDIALISNIGQYLSVDSRPVSCARGTFKQIISLYKSHVRSLKSNRDNTKVVDPFLRMNVVCPLGSYDANVEPAKDDVLFGNPDLVLRLAEDYFRSIYGELKPTFPASTAQEPSHRPQGIELLLARRTSSDRNSSMGVAPSAPLACYGHPSPEKSALQQHVSTSVPIPKDSEAERRARIQAAEEMYQSLKSNSHPVNEAVDESEALDQQPSISSSCQDHDLLRSSPEGSLSSPPRESAWKPSMYADEEDDMEQLGDALVQKATPVIEHDIDEDTLRNVEVTNPWTLAKLNAPFHSPARNPRTIGIVESNGQLPTPGRQQGDAGTFTDSSLDDLLHYSGPSMRGPMKHRPSSHSLPDGGLSSLPSSFPFPLRARGNSQGSRVGRRVVGLDARHHGRGGLDIWMQRSNSDSGNADNIGTDGGLIDLSLDASHPQHQRDFVSARSLPMGTPLSDIPDAVQRPRRKPEPHRQQQGALNKPFIPPVNDPERVWFNTGSTARSRQARQARPRANPHETTAARALMLRDSEDEESTIPAPLNESVRPLHPDLVIALDYEARKQKAIDQRRELLRQQAAAEKRNARDLAETSADASTNNLPTNSPHKNRQNKAIAALHTNEDPFTAATRPQGHPPAFEADDPRAYLLRVQQHEDAEQKAGLTASKSKRRKTTMLPFETLREDTYIGDLILQVKTSDLDIKSHMEKGRLCDEYVNFGENLAAFSSPTAQQIKGWEETLKKMVKASYRIEGMAPEEEMDGDLDVDLMAIWLEHVAQTADLTVS